MTNQTMVPDGAVAQQKEQTPAKVVYCLYARKSTESDELQALSIDSQVKEMGLRPGVAPTGYFNEKRTDKKCQVIVDTERALVVKQIFEKVAYEQWTGRRVYHWLRHELKFTTKTGKFVSLGNIYIILRNSYYYGVFEYPVGSGKWYTGTHTPLIQKELYEKVQEQLVRSEIRVKNKEFAFARLIACGLCGSSMCASEKYKPQKSGGTHRYIYYGCTRGKDKTCQAGYIKEEMIVAQLLEIVDSLDISEFGMRHKFKDEMQRYNKFRRLVLGKGKETGEPDAFEVKTYAKYLLAEGTMNEKRELLANLKSRLIFKDKKITLQK